jgi:histidinol phosphatase-like PHP family hydrolase
MTDIVERLRDYGLTLDENVIVCDRRVVDEAADMLARLLAGNSSSLSEARATGRREGLSEAATIIEEGFERGIERKQDTCAHGKFDWEDCEQCAVAAIRAAMEKEE